MQDGMTRDGQQWIYSEKVKEHFFNPKNLIRTQEEVQKYESEAHGVGIEGSAACGDMMKMWIKVDPTEERISECKWQTFGCASAIASTSIFSEMITENGGMTLEKALEIKPQDIVARLDGLPTNKYHCSVLADKALRAAVNDYYQKTQQYDRIKKSGVKIVDKILKITDHDIEEAVLEGVRNFEQLQKRTKIGIQDKNCIPEAEQLLRFYVEKYFAEENQ